MSATQTNPLPAETGLSNLRRPFRIRLLVFLASFVISVAAFVAFDYYYTKAILASGSSSPSANLHGLCFSRDPVRAFGFLPNCSAVRPWLGTSYEFVTNSLGFRDERIREVPATDVRPRILILGDSAPEGMTSWADSFIGRIANNFPQYDFLNGSVEGYSPSNYLNTERMVVQNGIDFDEVIVFIDISDAQDEAAFFTDAGASGAVSLIGKKMARSSAYSNLRLWINNNLLLTNDVFQYLEKAFVSFGWYHLDLGHGGNEFDLDRSAWTYRKVSDVEPYETGYAPLGLEGGIAKEKAKMGVLYRELKERNIPISVVVYPWPGQLAFDKADSRETTIWRDWCDGKCKRFVTLFPSFFAIKDSCPRFQPGCWYESHFIFGDTHYNSVGDALVADVIGKDLLNNPPIKRQPVAHGAESSPPAATSTNSRPEHP